MLEELKGICGKNLGREPDAEGAASAGRAAGQTAGRDMAVRSASAYTNGSLGADRFRHGLRNFRCVPRCRLPRKTDLQTYSCQRRQLRSSRLIAAEP